MEQESRDRRHIRAALVACAALSIFIVTAFVIATEPRGFRVAGGDPPMAGASSLARPHQPLDRAPGEPLEAPL